MIEKGGFRVQKQRVLWLALLFGGVVLVCLSRISGTMLAPIVLYTNPAPTVVPALREWYGGSGSFVLRSDAHILLDEQYAGQLRATAQVFQQDLTTVTGKTAPLTFANGPEPDAFFLTLRTPDSSLGAEGYTLNIGQSVTINARTSNGVFYGTRSLLQILRTDPYHRTLPKGFVRDYPRYKERGLLLDLGRKFLPLAALENDVRLMSWYKFNDLQLHFNDNAINGGDSPNWRHAYAAFRLNSPAFPGLAAADGSYTQQQIQELEEVANSHAITITPEIDTPAHSLALTQYRPQLASPLYSKEFLDLHNPATYTFVDDLWKTFLPWFTAAQIAIGVDEYSLHDPGIFRSYINDADQFLHRQGKTARMWGSLTLMRSSVQVHPDIVIEDWDNQWANPVDMARQGFNIINVNGNLLYIVPHAHYFHDFLDIRLLYERWTPAIFDLQHPALNLSPDDPHLLGGMFAVWNDLLGRVTSVQDITERIAAAFPVLGEKMWSEPTPAISYEQFEQDIQQVEAPHIYEQ